jgi:hypothetical protein
MQCSICGRIALKLLVSALVEIFTSGTNYALSGFPRYHHLELQAIGQRQAASRKSGALMKSQANCSP